jgi:hypothetical protein
MRRYQSRLLPAQDGKLDLISPWLFFWQTSALRTQVHHIISSLLRYRLLSLRIGSTNRHPAFSRPGGCSCTVKLSKDQVSMNALQLKGIMSIPVSVSSCSSSSYTRCDGCESHEMRLRSYGCDSDSLSHLPFPSSTLDIASPHHTVSVLPILVSHATLRHDSK